jgi:hypothetical protein
VPAPYKDFLNHWKDADPDIPILKLAKSEYAKAATKEQSPPRSFLPLR